MPFNPVENEEYYHGLLPREDVESLLTEPGEFLVRFTESNTGEQLQYVISVCSNVEREKKESVGVGKYVVKHIVLEVVNGQYTFDNRQYFNEVTELVDKYVNEKITFTVGKCPKKEGLLKAIKRPEWELKPEWISLGGELGAGQFGVVRKATLALPSRKEPITVAVKVAKITDNPEIRTKIREMMQEARTMRNFHHINVVALFGVAVAVEPLMLVLEFVEHGDLKNYLFKNPLTTETKTTIMLQAAQGIAYLHSRACIHRDIAARNCLVGGDPPGEPLIKISDFGLSRQGIVYDMKTDRPLPVRWLAPEVLNTHQFVQKSDFWSFSMLAMEIFSNGQEPYCDLGKAQAKEEIMNHNPPKEIPDLPEKLYDIFKKNVWVKDKARSTMDELIVLLGGQKCSKAQSGVAAGKEKTKFEKKNSKAQNKKSAAAKKSNADKKKKH